MDYKSLFSLLANKDDPSYENLNSNGQGGGNPTTALPLPNGGMIGEELSNYIKQNPGPEATTGVNLNLLQQEAPVEEPIISPQPVRNLASAPSPTVKDSVATSLAKSTPAPVVAPSDPYGSELNDAALKAAQESAKTNRMYGSLANAGSMLGAAFSRGTTKPVDIAKDFIENSDQDVKNIHQRREGKDKELSRTKHLADLDDENEMRNPNSSVSKNLRDGLKMVMPGMNVPENVSGKQLRDSGINLGSLLNAKQAADARRDAAAERSTLAKEKSDEKKTEKEKLSDKQVEGINEFDDSIIKAENVLNLLGKNSSWTGPVDGRVPDMLSGNDQVAFRAAVGRMQDSYRKLITGAGASNKEIARLESRIPSPNDTYANFQAKAKEFISELNKAKSSHLKNYKNQGKNTKNFEASSANELSDSSKEDPRVDAFMKANNIKDRNEAIKILKEAGHL